MAQFSRLRLTGFKSFVDKTDLDIGPGLTGVVGPNGCGKSNLVEALSWVMGETSAKRLRGSGMEDVIFNGTSTRPARNAAEVSVVLDNSKRTAPTLFNNTDEIEVVRRIEKDKGSDYYVNGKPVRARDVQMLFADLGIGAHSTAIVSQGRIAAIINAKPAERRQILEESAGVSGLYARRHEAELKLRAADANLARLQDVLANLETQLDGLKRQSRQARRYKDISESIKTLETLVALAEWTHAQHSLAKAQSLLQQAEIIVGERMGIVAEQTRLQIEHSEVLPSLREKQSETAAAWQAQNFELKRIDDEEARISAQIEEAINNLSQMASDRQHEEQVIEENALVLGRMDAEENDLKAQEGSEDELQRLTDTKETTQQKVEGLQSAYQSALEQTAHLKASRSTLLNQLSQDESRLNNIQQRLQSLRDQIEAKKSAQGDAVSTDDMSTNITNAETALNSLRETLESKRSEVEISQQNLDAARERFQTAANVANKTQAEISALQSVLQSDSQKAFRPILEDIKAEEGFEAALAKALGDTLMASTDADAPIIWSGARALNAPAFPNGVQPLLPKIQAPDALKTALSFIGFVENSETGENVANQLQPGQSIVSKDGAYWRWDGLFIRAQAVDAAAIRLKNKNRLAELEALHPQQQETNDAAQSVLMEAQSLLSQARQQVQCNEQAVREADRILTAQRHDLQRAIEQRASVQSELVKLEEALILQQDDMARLTEAVSTHQSSLTAFDEATIENLNNDIEQKRASLNEAQNEYRQATTDLQIFEQNMSRRHARLHAIADERVNLSNRTIRSRERLKQLEERELQTQSKLDELKIRPKELQDARHGLLDNLAALENTKNEAADKLAAAELTLNDTNAALKDAERLMSDAREARAHGQATLEAANGSIEVMRQSIQDQFSQSPEELWESSEMNAEKLNAEPMDRMRGKRDRLIRERDGMGPVNLRADVEAQEVEDQLSKLTNERNDLTQAIEELRGGIAKLNKEARERLMTAFNTVNEHFKVLFTRLFGGGAAHLAFIESEDPLEASLEIFAQPPGKSLQSLSLLSGGEKTLASTALLFAMFLTNPAPICVLDEIDAPLDDANVDRVCTLLEEMMKMNTTRFIVITHHRMTMARMNRLYGVTMAERGVSQLVSVDLQQKMEFLEAAE